MEGERKSGEVKVERCFHFFTLDGGQFSLKQEGKYDNREICSLLLCGTQISLNTQWDPLQLKGIFELFIGIPKRQSIFNDQSILDLGPMT